MAIPEVPNDIHWIVGFNTPLAPTTDEALREEFKKFYAEIYAQNKANPPFSFDEENDYLGVIRSNTAITKTSFDHASGQILVAEKIAGGWKVYILNRGAIKRGFENKKRDKRRLNLNLDLRRKADENGAEIGMSDTVITIQDGNISVKRTPLQGGDAQS